MAIEANIVRLSPYHGTHNSQITVMIRLHSANGLPNNYNPLGDGIAATLDGNFMTMSDLSLVRVQRNQLDLAIKFTIPQCQTTGVKEIKICSNILFGGNLNQGLNRGCFINLSDLRIPRLTSINIPNPVTPQVAQRLLNLLNQPNLPNLLNQQNQGGIWNQQIRSSFFNQQNVRNLLIQLNLLEQQRWGRRRQGQQRQLNRQLVQLNLLDTYNLANLKNLLRGINLQYAPNPQNLAVLQNQLHLRNLIRQFQQNPQNQQNILFLLQQNRRNMQNLQQTRNLIVQQNQVNTQIQQNVQNQQSLLNQLNVLSLQNRQQMVQNQQQIVQNQQSPGPKAWQVMGYLLYH